MESSGWQVASIHVPSCSLTNPIDFVSTSIDNRTVGVCGSLPPIKVVLALWPVPLMASCLHLEEKTVGLRYCDLRAMNEILQHQLGAGNDHIGVKFMLRGFLEERPFFFVCPRVLATTTTDPPPKP